MIHAFASRQIETVDRVQKTPGISTQPIRRILHIKDRPQFVLLYPIILQHPRSIHQRPPSQLPNPTPSLQKKKEERKDSPSIHPRVITLHLQRGLRRHRVKHEMIIAVGAILVAFHPVCRRLAGGFKRKRNTEEKRGETGGLVGGPRFLEVLHVLAECLFALLAHERLGPCQRAQLEVQGLWLKGVKRGCGGGEEKGGGGGAEDITMSSVCVREWFSCSAWHSAQSNHLRPGRCC